MSHAKTFQDPQYIGDGVYAGHDGYQVWIWTSNGIVESTAIALEGAVLSNLLQYAKRQRYVIRE